MAKNTICVWYEKDAEAAARFYAETFPDSAVTAVRRAPGDYPNGKEGDVLTEEYISNLPPEDQEAADQVNRRTEFQVLSVDYQMF